MDLKRGIFCLLFAGCWSPICASPLQDDRKMLDASVIKDSSAVAAVALYPMEVRSDLLKSAAHPQVLVKMQTLQETSKEKFTKLISIYSKEEQKKIWNLTRYDHLIERLVSIGQGSEEQTNKILKDFPDEIHGDARYYSKNNYELLRNINELNKAAKLNFENLLRSLPDKDQESFRKLLQHPEALQLLNDNMNMTVLWGDVYSRKPDLVSKKLDSLGAELAAQNAEKLKEWKEGLEKDPEAKKEYEDAAKEYAKEEGYKEEDIAREYQTINIYVYYPYPYWYGTPWWWDYPRWYPYPYWYDWGFYYSPHGIVYIGYPSWYFTYWYFHYPHHHFHHPHFTNHCINHYYGHRNSYTPVDRGVSEWISQNEGRLPADFLSNSSARAERIKEFGQFEMDYAKRETATDAGRISKDDYLLQNREKYPELRPEKKPGTVKGTAGERSAPVTEKSKPVISDPGGQSPKPVRTQPKVNQPKTSQPKANRPKPAVPKQKPQSQPRPTPGKNQQRKPGK